MYCAKYTTHWRPIGFADSNWATSAVSNTLAKPRTGASARYVIAALPQAYGTVTSQGILRGTTGGNDATAQSRVPKLELRCPA